MAEVLCPVCGKSNPPELEFCQKCQSRLKLVVDPFSLEDESQAMPDPFRLDDAPEYNPDLESSASMPDWLQSELDVEGGKHEEASSDDAIPDWLAGEASSTRVEPNTDDNIAANWLGGEELDEDVPDWLSSLGSKMRGETETLDIEIDDDAIADGDEEPEWLSRVRARKIAEEVEPIEPAEPTESPNEIFEEVVAQLEEAPGDDPLLSDERPESGEDEYPEWLTESGEFAIDTEQEDQGQPFEITEDEAIEEIGDSETEVPEWVAGLAAAEVRSETGMVDDQGVSDETGEAPDWVTGLVGAGVAGAVASKSGIGEEPEPGDTSERLSEQEADIPFSEEAVLPIDAGDTESIVEYSEDIYTIDKFLEREVAASEMDEVVVDSSDLSEKEDDIFDAEVAEWLSEIPADELDEDIAPEEEEIIEPADLPIWLAAMRPVDAVSQEMPTSEDNVQTVESTGPLAGLSGILPAEPAMARVKKSSAYAIKLRVSDNQQAHVAMLEELIKNEGTVKPIPEKARISSQHVLRLGIFIVLLLAIIWPVLTGSVNTPLPGIAPETLEARRIIDSISSGAPVLLAVEYEPGLSGEMDAASAGLVDHLMTRGAFLALVSTSTMGPAQAERLVSVINRSTDHNYQPSTQYVNLGYVPGGPTGLLGFATTPRSVLPYALDNSPIWESGPLSQVQNVGDFELVVVITEDADSARAWIEQVQPALATTPLVMVLSAQAEPMIRPYYEGSPRQVNGLVTGLAGGASYENTMPRTSLARKYWDAFSYGLLAAVVLIALGGVIVAAFSSFNQRDKADGDIGK